MEGETIHILIWDPMTNEMAETATVDTWTGDTIERTVLFAPNGAQFAVHEIDVTTSSPVQRLRVFAYGGELRWEAPRLTYVTAMAWSPDGTALAIGSLPIPWTVVQFGDTTIAAEPDVTTYQLDDQDGYALLGFSEDANTLYGYGTGGEAEYWEKLVALDRATGRLTQIDSIPPGATALSWANSTAPVDRFHPDGSIITRPGGARGDPTWALRTPGVGDVPIAVDPETVLTWGPDRQLVGLGTGFVADDGRPSLRLDLIDPTSGVAAALPQYAFPAGDYCADLRGARDGHALVLLAPSPSFTAKEAVVIELATGRAAVGLPPARFATRSFASGAGSDAATERACGPWSQSPETTVIFKYLHILTMFAAVTLMFGGGAACSTSSGGATTSRRCAGSSRWSTRCSGSASGCSRSASSSGSWLPTRSGSPSPRAGCCWPIC